MLNLCDELDHVGLSIKYRYANSNLDYMTLCSSYFTN